MYSKAKNIENFDNCKRNRYNEWQLECPNHILIEIFDHNKSNNHKYSNDMYDS